MSSLRVSNSVFFDHQNYLKYKSNIWDSSYKEGLYFSAMEELGQELVINIGLKKKNDDQTNWFKTPHALHDGYSALKVLSKEQGFRLELPKFIYRGPKSVLKAVYSAIKSSPKELHHFKNQSDNSNTNDFHYIRMNLPLPSQKFSDTALFSKVVCQTLMETLTTNESSRWMIPVRLRDDSGLHASYLGLEVKREDSVAELQRKIVEKLKGGQHWGFYFLSKIGLLLGKRAMISLTQKNVLKKETIWMGALSNLGDLGESEELDELTVLVPVRWHRPVGALIYKHNGEQILTVTFHDSLTKVKTDEISRKIKDIYKTYL